MWVRASMRWRCGRSSPSDAIDPGSDALSLPSSGRCLMADRFRIDARGITQMMRVGVYRPVHVKMLRSQKTAYAADPSQAIAVEGHRHRERSARDFA